MGRKKTGRPRGRPRKHAPATSPALTVPTFPVAAEEFAAGLEAPAAPSDSSPPAAAASSTAAAEGSSAELGEAEQLGDVPAIAAGAGDAPAQAAAAGVEAQEAELLEQAEAQAEKVVGQIEAAAAQISHNSPAWLTAEKAVRLVDRKILPPACKYVPRLVGLGSWKPGEVDEPTRDLVVKAGAVVLHTDVGLSLEQMSPRKFLLFALALYAATAVAGAERLPDEPKERPAIEGE